MPMVLRGIQEFKRSRLAFSAARTWILKTSTATTKNVAIGKRNSRGYFRSRHFLRAQPSKPTGSLRFSGILQNLRSGLLKIDQRTSTHARAPDQLIPKRLRNSLLSSVAEASYRQNPARPSYWQLWSDRTRSTSLVLIFRSPSARPRPIGGWLRRDWASFDLLYQIRQQLADV
jgi:hypothetical protein